MSTEVESIPFKGTILGLFALGFLVPPAGWVFVNWFSGICKTWDGLLTIILCPWLAAYVAVYLAGVLFLVNRKANWLIRFLQDPRGGDPRQAGKEVNSILGTFIVSLCVYCVVGPTTGLVGALGHISLENYLLSEFFGIPFIILFGTPFFLLVAACLERATKAIPFRSVNGFFTVGFKLAAVVISNLLGIALILILFSISLSLNGSDLGAGALGFRLVIVGLIACAVSTLNVLILRQQIIRSLRKVANAMRNVSEGDGDLTRKLTIDTRDEVGEMASFFNRFIGDIHDSIASSAAASVQLTASGRGLSERMQRTESVIVDMNKRIGEVGDQVVNQSASVAETSASAKQIVKNLESLGGVIHQQASNVTESSAAIEQMIANIRTVTVNVDHMVKTFSELKEATDDGRAKIQTLNEIISHVAEQSQILGQANTVINSIAAQTSLLSMNAAIEAAHAGTAGRGFAVVADEIRKLAEGSTVQSKEIGKNIKLIGTYINTGADASKTAKAAFDNVLERVGILGGQSSQVKAAMEEQSVGSKQILEAIAQINDITAQVQQGAGEMREGSLTIDDEMRKLLHLSEGLLEKTTELKTGTQVITEAVSQAQQSSAQTIDLAEAISQRMKQFKT